jgi:putative Holliday junction resolvase
MGRILALDFGQKKIGVAISNESRMFAQVLEPAILHDGKELERLGKLIKKYAVDHILIGLPTNLSGQAAKSVRAADEFILQLSKKIKNVPVERLDERFTTVAAGHLLRDQGTSRQQKKDLIDNTAAWVLLQGYLDTNQKKKI